MSVIILKSLIPIRLCRIPSVIRLEGDDLPGHVLRRNNSNKNDRTETDPSDKSVGAKIPQSLDKQNRRKNETEKPFSSDSARQGRERRHSGQWDPSASLDPEENQASGRNSSTSCNRRPLLCQKL